MQQKYPDLALKEILWKQFGASIDMIENAINACPQELWTSKDKFWYIAYHTLFFLDYYVSNDPENFKPPAPFTLSEFDPNGTLPERVYNKEEILTYLEYGRKKCYELIKSLTEEKLVKKFIKQFKNYSMFEMIIYNMRHVQHHAAQLNLLLRQNTNSAPGWVSQTEKFS